MKVSSVRVISTRYLPVFSIRSRSAPGEIEHDILLHDLAARPLGAGVDAAVAGIEHHQRPLVGAVRRRRAALRRFGAGGFAVERDFAQETLAIGRRQIEHEAGRRIGRGVDDEGLLDAGGLGQIEHHARAAGHHQAEAKRLDQAAAALAGLGRQLKRHLRDVEDDAVGVGERKGAHIDLAAQIHDEAGCRLVAAEPDVGRDRKRVGAGVVAGGPAARATPARTMPRKAQLTARTAIGSTPSRPCYFIRHAWLMEF